MYSPVRPFSPEERARMVENMQATYDTFVEKAAQGRNTTPERIDAIGQGRVWTGRQAKEIGSVDELGGLDAPSRSPSSARRSRRTPKSSW
jgi:protease-4